MQITEVFRIYTPIYKQTILIILFHFVYILLYRTPLKHRIKKGLHIICNPFIILRMYFSYSGFVPSVSVDSVPSVVAGVASGVAVSIASLISKPCSADGAAASCIT